MLTLISTQIGFPLIANQSPERMTPTISTNPWGSPKFRCLGREMLSTCTQARVSRNRDRNQMRPLTTRRSKTLSLPRRLSANRAKEHHLLRIIVAIYRNVHTENHFETIQK